MISKRQITEKYTKKDLVNIEKYTKGDFMGIDKDLIVEAVKKEGRPILAQTLGISKDVLRDWLKSCGLVIPIIRNNNYYNARKPIEEQVAYEDELCRNILQLMETNRDNRIKECEVEVICPTCGKVFRTNKDNPQKYCSKECVYNRVRSEEEKNKLSQSCMGRKAWNKGQKMADDVKERMIESVKKAWTDDKKKEQSIRQKKIWEDINLRKKNSNIAKELMTEEHKKLIREKTKEAMQRPEVKEKMQNTLLEKYGVPYGVLTPNCINATNVISKPNREWQSELNIPDSDLEFILNGYSYDMKVGDTLVEINPTFTHSTVLNKCGYGGKEKKYHIVKTIVANKAGYNCLHVWDWDDREKIKMILNQDRKKLYARNLNIREVNIIDCNTFLNKYHLQNACNGQTFRYGLYMGNELVQIMTFGKPRYNKNFEWELLRLCTHTNYKIVGGAERLFKHFILMQSPKSIISYCDKSKFSGDVYLRLGMEFSKSSHSLSRHWYNPKTKRHITDNLLKQRGFSQLHGDNEYKYNSKGESNEELMLEAGYLPVYDCGQASYTWNASE